MAATAKLRYLVFRQATLKDANIITRRAIQEGWNIGPYDFHTYISFDPKSYHIVEINRELAAHFGVTEFPKHHYHYGGLIVSEQYRHKGIETQCHIHVLNACNKEYTLGGDTLLETRDQMEALGFQVHWDTYAASLNINKVAKTIINTENCPSFVKPLTAVDSDKLLQYDKSVFGTSRDAFMRKWINTPGSFGWAAIDKSSNEITGYTVLKQAIRGGGTEIGLAMAPLFADNIEIVKLLLKCAADECLTNPAIPKQKLEITHPVGENCGEGAVELMRDLDAELVHICLRMYNKGIPPGRQLKKIYGIASPSCD